MIHHVKIIPPFFEDVMTGRMTFQVRNNDRQYRVGDVMLFQEYSDGGGFTGRMVERRVVYVLDRPDFGLRPGHVALGLGHL